MTRGSASVGRFLGPARTANYRPGLISGGRASSWAISGNWQYTPADAEVMRRDGLVQFCLRSLYAPLATVTATVDADDPEAGQEAEETFARIWQQELPKLFISVAYGWLPAEVLYEWDDSSGRVLFDSLAEVHPLDAVPLQRGRRLAGIALRGSAAPLPRKGEADDGTPPHWLLPPRSLWVAHEPEFGSLYGRGRLQAMWLPWLERVGRHGYLDIRRTWYAKNAYRGGEIRYPDGEIEVAPGQWMSNRDFATMLVEQEETGSVMALPNTRGLESGEYEWVRTPAAPNGDIPGILEYGDRLFHELLLAAGIPPEMVIAGGTGSGWSGRNVPHLSFLKAEDGLADGIAQAIWRQIVVPQVAANHGERRARGCKLRVKSLVPPEADGGMAGGVPGAASPFQMAQDGGGGGNPWQPYLGPRGGKGWRHVGTGEVIYDEERPGTHGAGGGAPAGRGDAGGGVDGSSPSDGAAKEKPPGKRKASKGKMVGARRVGAGTKNDRVVLKDGSLAPAHITPAMIGEGWSNVMISMSPEYDVQVKARDEKGKAVTVYSDAWDKEQAAIKFARTMEGISKMHEMHNQVMADRKDAKKASMADCCWLMMIQATRVGSNTDNKGTGHLFGVPLTAKNFKVDKEGGVTLRVKGNSVLVKDKKARAEIKRRLKDGGPLFDSTFWLKSHGATTLQGRHVVIRGKKTYIEFMGKESVWHSHEIKDQGLAKMLRDRKSAAGDGGLLFGVSYGVATKYVKTLDGGKFTPKDLRTQRATKMAIDLIRDMEPPETERARKASIKAVGEEVSRLLGNEASQALTSYIAPEVFSVWQASQD